MIIKVKKEIKTVKYHTVTQELIVDIVNLNWIRFSVDYFSEIFGHNKKGMEALKDKDVTSAVKNWIRGELFNNKLEIFSAETVAILLKAMKTPYKYKFVQIKGENRGNFEPIKLKNT